ncbi:MAG: ABC transporter substrate-binding protein [Rhizobiaceae bacterium]|nr:ABC transporter substrate-binding protein [Rhizobiaceae bacterium]
MKGMEARQRHGCGSALRALAVATALAMGSAIGAQAQEAPGITADAIDLGGVFALSGPVYLVTEDYQKAIQAYFNKINEEGGINGRKIEWQVEDDAYQPARTLAGAKKLVERDDVFMIFGQMGTSTTQAVAPYAEEKQVPFMTVNASPQPPFKYTFGLMAEYPDVMYRVARYLIDELKIKKIGYLYQNDDLGKLGREGIQRALDESSMKLIEDVGFERGAKDFSTQVLRLRDSGAEAVIAMTIAPQTATAIKQADGIGFSPTWATFSVGGTRIMKELVGDKLEGLVYGTEIDSTTTDTPAAKELLGILDKYYPKVKFDWGSAIGYAHAKVVVEALKAAGQNPTRDSMMQAIQRPEGFDVGLMDKVNFDGKHSGASAIRIYRWEGGEAKPVTDWIPTEKK